MDIFLLVPIGTHFQLMMHQNSADINGFSSKCLECHPGNRIYLGEAHVRSHRLEFLFLTEIVCPVCLKTPSKNIFFIVDELGIC